MPKHKCSKKKQHKSESDCTVFEEKSYFSLFYAHNRLPITLRPITTTNSPIPLFQVVPNISQCRSPQPCWNPIFLCMESIQFYGLEIPKHCGGCYFVQLLTTLTQQGQGTPQFNLLLYSYNKISQSLSLLNDAAPSLRSYDYGFSGIVCLTHNDILVPAINVISLSNMSQLFLTIQCLTFTAFRLDDCPIYPELSSLCINPTTLTLTRSFTRTTPTVTSFSLIVNNTGAHAAESVILKSVITVPEGTITNIEFTTFLPYSPNITGINTDQVVITAIIGTIANCTSIFLGLVGPSLNDFNVTTSIPDVMLINTVTLSAINIDPFTQVILVTSVMP